MKLSAVFLLTTALAATLLFDGRPSFAAARSVVPRFAPHEVTLTASGNYANPYTDCTADCALTAPDGQTKRVLPLFWDGGTRWRFRFSPDQTGAWRWAIKSQDGGLNGQSGEFTCAASELPGAIQSMSGAPTHFQYQNGERIWFLGDTQWSLFTDNADEKHDRATVERYLRNRVKQGFNVVHAMLLNEAGWGNAGGPPWSDLSDERLNPGYWQEVDTRIALANSMGVTVGLALAWGEKTSKQTFPWGRFPSVEARHRYARYIAARYSAYDVYFLVSGEWQGEVKSRQATEAEVKREFIEIGDTLRAADPHKRMIGIHPMTRHGSTREFNDAAWMSFGDYQQNYIDLHERVIESLRFAKPVVNSEYAYYLRDSNGDGVVDKHHSFTVSDIRNATWDIVMAGGYVVTGFGSTYMGGHRHPTPFLPDDPANEPWEREIGLVKQLFTKLEYWKLKPHDDLLTCEMPRGENRSKKVDIRNSQKGVNQVPATAYWCLAEPGRQYLVYVRGLKPASKLKLQAATGLRASQFNPRTGDWKDLGLTESDRFAYQPCDEQDWVVVLRSEK